MRKKEFWVQQTWIKKLMYNWISYLGFYNIVKLSPSPSQSWAVMALFSLNIIITQQDLQHN